MPIGAQLRQNILGIEETGNGLTNSLWADCPLDSIKNGAVQGTVVEPNFVEYDTTATTVQNNCGLPTFEGDCTVACSITVGGGVVLFGTTSNEEASIQFPSNAVSPFVIPADSADGKQLWFECEIKKSIIGATEAGFYVGLANAAIAIAGFMSDDGTDFGDGDLLGFWNRESEANVDVITQKGTALPDVIADAAEVLVADTYTRLGFIYDPAGPAKKKIKFYVNGKEVVSGVGENDGDATVYLGDTTNFPGGEMMTPVVALKMAGGNDVSVTLRKLRCVQLL